MTDLIFSIAIVFLAIANFISFRLLLKLRRSRQVVDKSLLSALASVVSVQEEQMKINHSQHALNQVVSAHMEILGVHTKLIKPSIGFEAERYLNYINNKKKEENNES